MMLNQLQWKYLKKKITVRGKADNVLICKLVTHSDLTQRRAIEK